jgi:hypothetical protein
VSAMLRRNPGLPVHLFGTKASGLARYRHKVLTADSLSWSHQARGSRPLAGHQHRSCAKCSGYALQWRRRVLAATRTRQLPGLGEAA